MTGLESAPWDAFIVYYFCSLNQMYSYLGGLVVVWFILVQYAQARMCSWVLRALKKTQHIDGDILPES